MRGRGTSRGEERVCGRRNRERESEKMLKAAMRNEVRALGLREQGDHGSKMLEHD